MGSALGNTSARAANGTHWFDIRDFGAVPNSPASGTKTRKAIQAAVDAATTDTYFHTVFIPSGDWYVDRPVMVDRYVHLVGEPGGRSVVYGQGETTPIVVGIPRQGYVRSEPLAPVHLDGGTGATFKGLYLDPDEHVCIPLSPFSHGSPRAANPQPYGSSDGGALDAYMLTTECTLEWRQELGNNPLYCGPLAGMNIDSHAQPWVIGYGAFGVRSATVTSGGSGYTSAPTVAVAVSGGGSGVSATATVAGGAVNGVTITSAGVGIQPGSTFTVTFTGGGGTGAAATIAAADTYATANVAGTISVQINTNDGSKWGAIHQYHFVLPAGLSGTANFAVTMSPKQGFVAAWANGVQLPAVQTNMPMTAGMTFQQNIGIPLQIASDNALYTGAAGTFKPAAPVPTLNRNFTGLRFWNTAPYTNGANGSAQSRVDAKPLDPGVAGSRYTTQEPGVLAWIPFTDTPADVLAYRQFTVMFGNGTAALPSICGYIVPNNMPGFDWQQGSCRDLNLICLGNYGAGMMLGFHIDYEIRDCSFDGMYGLYEIPTGANYVLKLTGLNSMNAQDTGMFLWYCSLEQSGNIRFYNYNRACVTAVANSTIKFELVFIVYPKPQAQYFFRVNNGLEIQRLGIDSELYLPSLKYAIWMEAYSTAFPTGLYCLLDNVGLGNFPASASLIYLDERDGGGNYGEVKLGMLSLFQDGIKAVIETTGPSARGDFVVSQDMASPWVLNSGPGGVGSMRATHRVDCLPRRGSFAKDSSVLRMNHPVDGQFTGFRCSGTGALQTGAPGAAPRWIGLDPLDDSGAGLATYIQANPCWTSGNTNPHRGPYADFSASVFLNGYLGVGGLEAGGYLNPGVPPPPSPLVVALGVDPIGAVGSSSMSVGLVGEGFTEAKTTGAAPAYVARQPISFGASVAGVASNNAAVTFPALATLVGYNGGYVVKNGITCLALIDPATNLIIGMIPLDFTATAAGQVISFPAGSLKVQPVPVPVGGPLAPQMGCVGTQVFDACHNFFLRGQALTPPTGLQFALSTAPASRAAPTEPIGGGYARVPAPAWNSATTPFTVGATVAGAISNGASVKFASPSGSWGTIKSLYLLDGPGNVIFSGNVTIPRAVGSGSPAPTIAAGAFWVSW